MGIRDVIPAGDLVAVDTAPFIYYIEGGSPFDALAVELFEDCIDSGRNPANTTVVTLAEVLVGAFVGGRPDIADRYRDILLAAPQLTLAALTPDIAERAARLRADYRLKLPDAIQLASALATGASHFLTNDDGFTRVAGIEKIAIHILYKVM
jgi:predicted nucleic acid-binding protein